MLGLGKSDAAVASVLCRVGLLGSQQFRQRQPEERGPADSQQFSTAEAIAGVFAVQAWNREHGISLRWKSARRERPRLGGSLFGKAVTVVHRHLRRIGIGLYLRFPMVVNCLLKTKLMYPYYAAMMFHPNSPDHSAVTRVATKPNFRPVIVTVPAICDLSFVHR